MLLMSLDPRPPEDLARQMLGGGWLIDVQEIDKMWNWIQRVGD